MEDFLTAPPEGALDTAELEYLQQIEYKSGKTPEQFVKHATESLNDDVLAGRVGFYVYDREARATKTIINPAFVVIDAYAGVEGSENKTRFWSNRAKDSRVDILRVFSSDAFTWKGDKKIYQPIAEGLYKAKATNAPPSVGGVPLPKGASFTIYLVVMMVHSGKVYEMKVTSAVRQGLEDAIKATGQKRAFLLGLVENDHIWGFRQTGFAPVNREGLTPYNGKGEMVWSPTFKAGIIDPSKSLELHTKACQAQEAEQRRHAAFIAADQKRRAEIAPDPAPAHEPQSAQPAPPIQTNVRASSAASAFPTTAQTPPLVEQPAGDDLPF